MYCRLGGGEVVENIPLWVTIPLFWEDSAMDIWLLKGNNKYCRMQKFRCCLSKGIWLMHNNVRSCFIEGEMQLCKLFSKGKCFNFI